MPSRTWKSVSKASPCRICDSPDWCRTTDDATAAMCRRVLSGTGGAEKTDLTGAPYGLFFFGDGGGSRSASDDEVSEVADYAGRVQYVHERAGIDTRHQVYSRLIELLTIYPRHEHNLRGRGFTVEEAHALGYP